MKRADLKVGAEYLAHPSHDWAQGTWRQGARIRVLDAGFWDVARGFSAYRDAPPVTLEQDGVTYRVGRSVRPAQDGTQGRYVIAVELDAKTGKVCHHHDDGTPWAQAYLLSEIRDTWAEGSARVKAAQERRDAERERREADERAARAREADLNERLSTLLDRPARIRNLNDVAALIDLAEGR